MVVYRKKKKVLLSSQELEALDGMLGALQNNRLEVILIPDKQINNAVRGKKIRMVVQVNAEWYRRVCADFPNARERKNRAFDTAITRRETLSSLNRMLRTKIASFVYDHRILKYIPGFLRAKEDQFQFEKASYESSTKHSAASLEQDDWAPF